MDSDGHTFNCFEFEKVITHFNKSLTIHHESWFYFNPSYFPEWGVNWNGDNYPTTKQLLILLHTKQGQEFKTVNFDYSFNKSLCFLEFDEANLTFIGASKYTLLRDFRNLEVNITIKSLRTENVLIDKNINLCFFARQRKSNIFFRFFFDDIFKYANFRFECPFKKVSCKANKITQLKLFKF